MAKLREVFEEAGQSQLLEEYEKSTEAGEADPEEEEADEADEDVDEADEAEEDEAAEDEDEAEEDEAEDEAEEEDEPEEDGETRKSKVTTEDFKDKSEDTDLPAAPTKGPQVERSILWQFKMRVKDISQIMRKSFGLWPWLIQNI